MTTFIFCYLWALFIVLTAHQHIQAMPNPPDLTSENSVMHRFISNVVNGHNMGVTEYEMGNHYIALDVIYPDFTEDTSNKALACTHTAGRIINFLLDAAAHAYTGRTVRPTTGDQHNLLHQRALIFLDQYFPMAVPVLDSTGKECRAVGSNIRLNCDVKRTVGRGVLINWQLSCSLSIIVPRSARYASLYRVASSHSLPVQQTIAQQ